MQAELLLTVATAFALTWSFGAVLALLCPGRTHFVRGLFYAGAGLSALAFVIWMNGALSLGRNSVIFLTNTLMGHDLRQLCAAGLGVSIGFGPAVWPWQRAWSEPARGVFPALMRTAGFLCILSSFGFVAALAMEDQIRPYVSGRNLGSFIVAPGASSVPEGFVLEEHFTCDSRPVQIVAANDNTVYATAYSGLANQNGVVIRLSEDRKTGAVVETKVARNLNRPHGLALHEGVLYVSRSGQYTRAESGAMIETNTGAVTMLKDLDGDGVMDYYHDVISGLPGSQGPDTLHQNNGITFSPDGDLYVTVGVHSDRGPATQEFEGTIVRSRADGSDLAVFARGLRNPFDVVFGPDGELFCTDNDASDLSSGDELNHVVRGTHYGFPYADGKMKHPPGTTAPILVHTKGTLQGLAYTDSTALPREYRNCLYVVDYPSGNIQRVKLIPDRESYRAKSTLFARVPGALDITVDEHGVFYVSCHASRQIYRIRYTGETAS